MRRSVLFSMVALAILPVTVSARSLPTAVEHQLPQGYSVRASATMKLGKADRTFFIVALVKNNEEGWKDQDNQSAPARPLVIFERREGRVTLVGRNDHVVLRADEGGQCDPFDNDNGIATKGRFFTVENGVACGQHWSDFVTFRFDDRLNAFTFANQRIEAWTLNPSNEPNAEALIRDGKPRVRRPRPGQTIPFDRWRPAR